ATSGWACGEVYIDARVSGSADGYNRLNSTINMEGKKFATPLEYFMFFLPTDHFYTIIENTNTHARSLGHWLDITFSEYLLWIALLSVM
ncbi:hypothetical protein, partial [Salmonella enterica]|uniref:hypothetical protein n=1 Tax=Salmonella enterica TaxID=28901 RepID=UPI001E4679EB